MINDPEKTPIPEGMTAPTRATPRPSRRAYTMRAALVGTVAAVLVLGLLSCLLVVGLFTYYQTLGLIVPGVHVGVVPLGGKDVDAASAALLAAWGKSGEITMR